MDELTHYLKNKRNLINILILLIIILGIPVGIAIQRGQQVLKSRADVAPIQLVADENCVVDRNGKKVAKCEQVTVQIVSPLGGPADPSQEVCPQIITRACSDVDSLVCNDFPTPCDVPSGWTPVQNMPSPTPVGSPDISPSPTSTPAPSATP